MLRTLYNLDLKIEIVTKELKEGYSWLESHESDYYDPLNYPPNGGLKEEVRRLNSINYELEIIKRLVDVL